MGYKHGYVFLVSSNVPNVLQICVHVRNHPVMDTPVAVQEIAIVSPTPVAVDIVLLVTGLEHVLLVVFGQEVSQPAN